MAAAGFSLKLIQWNRMHLLTQYCSSKFIENTSRDSVSFIPCLSLEETEGKHLFLFISDIP